MRKQIKKDGNSHKIRINSEDMNLYDLKEEEIINIELSKLGEGKNEPK